MTEQLFLRPDLPVKARNAGLFVSRGRGSHPDRVINSHELIFVRRGILKMKELGTDFIVKEGQTLLLYPNRRHAGTETYPSDLEFYWVHFNILKKSAAASGRLEIPQVASPAEPDRLTNLFRRFLNDQESGILAPAVADLTVCLMLAEVALGPSTGPEKDPAAVTLASRAGQFIRTSFAEPISTSDVARAVKCSPDYLGKVFRQVFGQSVTERIHTLRIRHARDLLLHSDENIDEIARSSGFSDSGYFRRIFKRHEGLPPGRFRRLYARIHVNTQ